MSISNKLLIFSTLAIVIITFFFIFFYSHDTKNPIPSRFLGNWINKGNNNWEYGFFEDFAIFNKDFWEYQEVKYGNNGRVNLVLKNQHNIIRLQLDQQSENQLIIRQDHKKQENYVLMGAVYPTYPTKDTSAFSVPSFQVDSVTIIGYYRNLNSGIKGFVDRFFRSPFEIVMADFIKGEDVKFYGDIDNLGRFKVTFPVMNTQELYVDWKRTRLRAVVEPGDTLFLFADIQDYLPTADDKRNYEAYIDRPKQVLFMGKNARLNNELKQYTYPWFSIDKASMTNLTDMEYLHGCEEVYKKRTAQLDKYITENPTASRKFITYRQKEEKYDFAFNLMQHRFDIYSRAQPRLQKEYMSYVKENFPLHDELDYTITRYFGRFLSDYIGYIGEVNYLPTVLFDEIGERLQNNGELTVSIETQINEINKLASNNTANNEAIAEELKIRSVKLNADKLVQKTAEILHAEKMYLSTDLADSVISSQNLQELWITNRYHYWFEVLRKPISDQKQIVFKQKVKNPYFRNLIDKMQGHYGNIANEGITYEASLKNTEHLNGYKDAEKLFEELIRPYKGKVIYVDFWGTWCGGCRRDLQTVNKLKGKLGDKEVVFMYFANRSPESTWKNLIKEMQLTGENTVHYRLPDEQQAMIERKLGVNVFPTYMLINKEGILVNEKAKSPANIDDAIQEIKKLL